MIDPDRFQRALATVAHRKLREHEAAHAAAALILGLDVRSAQAPFHTFEGLRDGDPDSPAGAVHVEGDDRRAFLLTTLAGPFMERQAYWPPKYPPTLAPITPDEAQVGEHVRALDLTAEQYAEACDAARALIETPIFKSLHERISDALTDRDTLDAGGLRRLHIRAQEANPMQHVTLKARTAVTDTDLGQFEAVVSAWGPDREQDTIARTAFDKTITAWQRSRKMLPLLFEHSTEAIGHIDPATMRPTEAGLIAAGEIDRSTEHGEQAWRQIKAGSAGFSIGFMGESKPRPGGGREILEIDLLEISYTSTPMHPAAKVLGWKSTGADTFAGLWEQVDAAAQVAAASAQAAEELKAKALRVAREVEPVGVVRFPC